MVFIGLSEPEAAIPLKYPESRQARGPIRWVVQTLWMHHLAEAKAGKWVNCACAPVPLGPLKLKDAHVGKLCRKVTKAWTSAKCSVDEDRVWRMCTFAGFHGVWDDSQESRMLGGVSGYIDNVNTVMKTVLSSKTTKAFMRTPRTVWEWICASENTFCITGLANIYCILSLCQALGV